jgi:protein TonB
MNMVKSWVLASVLMFLILNYQAIARLFGGGSRANQERNIPVELTEVQYVEAPRHLPLAPEVAKPARKKPQGEGEKSKVKEDDQVAEDAPASVDEHKNEEADKTATDGKDDSKTSGEEEGLEENQSDTPTPEQPVSTGEPQKVLLEQVPSYSGGEKEMLRFIYANIRYPDAARDAGIVGTAYISFIVEKDGSITNVTIKQDLGKGCGNEAARVVRIMPRWVPGKLAGRTIRTQLTLPIEFKLLEEVPGQ